MLKIYAESLVVAARELTVARSIAESIIERHPDREREFAPAKLVDPTLTEALQRMRVECETLDLRLTAKHIDRFLNSDVDMVRLSKFMEEIYWRYRDELTGKVLYTLEPTQATFYEDTFGGWTGVIERFHCSYDVEEGRKCLALGRYTASVFHLMKVVETAVLELQIFLQAQDVKAHFGSVLGRLEQMVQRTKYEHVPVHLQPYLLFLKEILSQLHAVKDSWRDKAAHVDARIVPIDTFTPELAVGVHDATLLLMKKLADGLPAKDA